jgi:hypothetical protein
MAEMEILAVMTAHGPVPADIIQFTLAPAQGFVPARLGI